MDLYLVPDDPENTTLMSADGTAHFRVTTMGSLEGSVTYLQQPSECLEDGLLAEVHSEMGKRTTIVRSTLMRSMMSNQDERSIDASSFLYRKGRVDVSSWYFVGKDGAEYRWKYQKTLGWTLTKCSTGDEITQQVRWRLGDGVFTEKKRRAMFIKSKAGGAKAALGDDDPIDGGMLEADGETGSMTFGEL